MRYSDTSWSINFFRFIFQVRKALWSLMRQLNNELLKGCLFSSSARNFFWFPVFHFSARALSRRDVSLSSFIMCSSVVISGTVPQGWPLGNLTYSGCLLNMSKVFFSSESPQRRQSGIKNFKAGFKGAWEFYWPYFPSPLLFHSTFW